MDTFVAIIAALVTLSILNNSKLEKTSWQLMLLGLELTIVGAVLILIVVFTNSNQILFLVGTALKCCILTLYLSLYNPVV